MDKKKVRFHLNVLLLDSSLEGDLEQVTACLNAGASVNATNEEGLTALHSSSCNGHGTIVKYLIEQGAEVNAVDDDKWTPLHGAACFGEVVVTRYLIVHGANLNAMNESGDTPLGVAVEDNTKKCLQGMCDPPGKPPLKARNQNLSFSRCHAELAHRINVICPLRPHGAD